MKKQSVIIGGVLAVFAMACVFGGPALAEQMKNSQEPEPTTTTATEPITEPEPEPSEQPAKVLPSFIMPTPAPSKDPDAAPDDGLKETVTSTSPGTGVTITEDEDGNQVIRPNWSTDGSLPEGANVVPAKPELNISGGGGGKMDLDADGVYHGDHPNGAPTPAPTPKPKDPTDKDNPDQDPGDKPKNSPDETTPPKDTPTPDKPSNGGPPPDDGTYKDRDISPDGNYMYWPPFGWVENGPGSYSVPGKGTHTELGGETVGSM